VLYRYSEVFRTVLVVADLVLVGASWIAAYYVRFFTGFEAPLGVPEFRSYVFLLAAILPLFHYLLRSRDLYEPKRTSALLPEVGAVLGATATGVVGIVVLTFFLRSEAWSRSVVGLFFAFSFASVAGFRVGVRSVLHALRRRGKNLRFLLVIGGGALAEEVIARIHEHPEAGLRVQGVLTDDPTARSRGVRGVAVVGGYAGVKEALRRQRIDQVIVALPREDGHHLEKILADLDDELVTVRVVPDLLHVLTLRSAVEDLDGLPMIALREGPLVGWAAVQKRVFDLVVTSLGLLVAAPIVAALALAVWVTSGRPIFFSQERMGLDGRTFRMWKLRTMRVDAEAETGAVWTTRDDPRRTRLGALLRRTSLDELPQLWNVLRGDMSLVGPRAERPVFVEQFRREIPGYMLRHKIKAGLTGWAQVHGWRGDTSLHERVEHDIYYIQNWSLGLDVRILLMTFWRGFFHGNAY
jgi:Undecaprenyl-phosphate glucose phosphotransferase